MVKRGMSPLPPSRRCSPSRNDIFPFRRKGTLCTKESLPSGDLSTLQRSCSTHWCGTIVHNRDVSNSSSKHHLWRRTSS